MLRNRAPRQPGASSGLDTPRPPQYFTRKDNLLIIMLAGGSKATQSRDIARAQKILLELEAEA
jgi:hypothetical protein